MTANYVQVFEGAVQDLFRDALRTVLRAPDLLGYLLKVKRWQQRAATIRADWGQQGLNVPPFIIFSVTNRCNLKCAGCYHHAQGRSEPEMDTQRMKSLLQEASELGISIALLAGGEPFMRPDLLEVTATFPQIIFPVFTNGLLLQNHLQQLRQQRNILPVISIEGDQKATDARRGSGLHAELQTTLSKLQRQGSMFGISLTVTRDNFELVTSAEFAGELVQLGAKVIFYISFVPVDQNSDALVLTPEQSRAISPLMQQLRDQLDSLFIAFPGDEDQFGGCLAAGRGFVHISAAGKVEPCPFAPYSDRSLAEVSLREALDSPFLRKIRDQHALLQETQGGCALWEQREWVKSLLTDEC